MTNQDYPYPMDAPSYREDFTGIEHLRQYNDNELAYPTNPIQEQPLYQQLDAYGHGYALDNGGSPYPDLPDTDYHGAYQTPPRAMSGTPHPMEEMPLRVTRSGRSLGISRSASQGIPALGPVPSRVEKSIGKRPRRQQSDSRASSAAPGGRKKKPLPPNIDLQKPLSQLVGDIPPEEAQDTDVETWVKRTSDERQSEVSRSKNCKIKRPPNAFMLYRMAYQKRASARFQHDNHQVISKICGASWAMEDNNIRRQFIQWSSDEREAHAKAFPEYRFTPAKNKRKGQASGRSGGAGFSDDEVDELGSDLGDFVPSPAAQIYEPDDYHRTRGMSHTPYRGSLTPSPAPHIPFGSDSLSYPHPTNGPSGYQYRHYNKPQPQQPQHYLRASSITPSLSETTYMNHNYTSMPVSSNDYTLSAYPNPQSQLQTQPALQYLPQPNMNQAHHQNVWAANATPGASYSMGPTAEFRPSPSPPIDPSLLSVPGLEGGCHDGRGEGFYTATPSDHAGTPAPAASTPTYNGLQYEGLSILPSIEYSDFGPENFYQGLGSQQQQEQHKTGEEEQEKKKREQQQQQQQQQESDDQNLLFGVDGGDDLDLTPSWMKSDPGYEDDILRSIEQSSSEREGTNGA